MLEARAISRCDDTRGETRQGQSILLLRSRYPTFPTQAEAVVGADSEIQGSKTLVQLVFDRSRSGSSEAPSFGSCLGLLAGYPLLKPEVFTVGIAAVRVGQRCLFACENAQSINTRI